MTGERDAYRFPYTSTPGTSTAPPETTPEEGTSEFWAFFWLALVNTAIIVVAGVVTWHFVH
jgi:hypothetical protein